MARAPGNRDDRRKFLRISWPALLILGVWLGKVGWAFVDREWGPGGVAADVRAEHAVLVRYLEEELRHDREAKDRAVAEGRRTRVRIATSDGSPFRALLVFVPGHPGAGDDPPVGHSALMDSPVVKEFDLAVPEIEVFATAAECRPGRVRAGRIAPGGPPFLLVLQAARRLRGRIVGVDGRPVARAAVRLVVGGPPGDLPAGDGGAPPVELAALFRDRWGMEHLVDAVVDVPRASAWTVTDWHADEDGRFEAFSPVEPATTCVLLQSADGGWRVAATPSPASGDGPIALGDIRSPRADRSCRFTLRYGDGSPVASRRIVAQPARFPPGLRAAWVELRTDSEGRVAASPLDGEETYRFIEDSLPLGTGGGVRWGGDQGVGIPSPEAILVLSRVRPSARRWTGWEVAPGPSGGK